MSPSVEMVKYETLKEPVVLDVKDAKVFGIIHRPITSEKTPAILILHGFASSKVGQFRIAHQLSERLAEKGITSLRIDFRGCGDSDLNFDEMTLTTQMEDALSGIRFLNQDSAVDNERIGLLGRSLGGTIAAKTAPYTSIKALALWVPFFGPSEKERHLIQDHGPGAQFVQEMKDLDLAKSIQESPFIPWLQIFAGKDPVLDPSHRERFVKARKDGHPQDRLIMLGEADHVFSRIEDRQKLLQETEQWFLKVL